MAAFASALCYGAAMVLQHRSAATADDSRLMRPSMLTFVGRQPLWWLGIGANGLALALRLVALRNGSLLVVQAVLCTSLLVALPLSAAWHHQRLGRLAAFGALCVTVGLVAFVRNVPLTDSRSVPGFYRWTGAAGVLIGIGTVAVLIGTRRTRHRATFYGISGGCFLALTGSLMKAFVEEAQQGIGQLISTYPLYALCVSGVVMMVVTQSAFAAGSLVASLPALLASEIIGTSFVAVAVFQEHLMKRSNHVPGVIALSLLVVGVVATAIATAVRISQPLDAPSAVYRIE